MGSFFDSLLKKLKTSSKDGLAKYTLFRSIGKGSMSDVFLAKDEKGNRFAVKVLDKKMIQLKEKIDAMRGGLKEGELAATFDHPNIIKTYEWGVDGKQEYIVMELIEGVLLKNMVGTDVKEIKEDPVKLFMEMGAGLSYIHKRGYIHRDFNPKNIFLTKDKRVVVFDFGLAVRIDAAMATQGRRTGTPSYMAPELIRRARTDHRTDIYSFGAMMYEVLTGQKPFGGSGTIEKMIQLLNAEPRDPRDLNRDIADEVAEVILGCLVKKPDGRIPNVDVILKRFESYRRKAGLPKVTPPVTDKKEALKTRSR